MTDNHHDPFGSPPQPPVVPPPGAAASRDDTRELPSTSSTPSTNPGTDGMRRPEAPVREPFVAGGFPPSGDRAQPYSPPVVAVPSRTGSGGRHTGRTVAVIAAVVVVLVGAAAAVYFGLRPGDDIGIIADNPSTAPADDSADGTSADDRPTEPSDDSSGSTEPVEEETDAGLASRPMHFGAWFAGGDTYEGKWIEPTDNGGQEITGYLVTDCAGTELATVEASVLHVTVHADALTCMAVQAVTEAGPGEAATFEIG